MQRLPLDLTVEFRAIKPAGSFTRKDSGEVVEIPPRVKCEYTRDDGDIEIIEVRVSELDKCEPPFDYKQLKRGDHVRLRGDVMLAPRGSDKDSYVVFTSAERAGDALVSEHRSGNGNGHKVAVAA
jgi:hypothetical protein